MAMARCGVTLHAHECDRVIHCVEEPVKVPPHDRPGDILVIPVPNNFATVLTDREGADGAWHAEVSSVVINDPVVCKKTLEIPFTEFRLVHADRIRPHVDKCFYTSNLESFEQFVPITATVADGVKVGVVERAFLIPFRFLLLLDPNRVSRESEFCVWRDPLR